MKKIILIACAVALALTTGCSTDKTVKEMVTISWYYASDTGNPMNSTVHEKANEIIQKKLGFNVDFKPLDFGTYEEKMKMVMAGGEEYDIAWTSNWYNNYFQNVSNGAFMELDALLDKQASALKGTIKENIWNGTRINGKIYGVPCQQIMARSAAIALPEEFAIKYANELSNIKKYDDLEPYIKAVTTDYNVQMPVSTYWLDLSYAYGVEEVLGSGIPGAVYLNGDGKDIKVFNQYESEEWLSIIRARKRFFDAKYTPQGTTTGVVENSTKGLLPQDRPIIDISTYKPGGDVEASKKIGFPVRYIKISDTYLTSKSINSTLNAINSSSKHPIESIKFLEFMSTDKEIMNLMSYGIEGINYTKVDDKTISLIPDSGFGNAPWMMGNTFNTYLVQGQPIDAWEQTKEINDTAKNSRILGFCVDMDPIKVEINNCKSVMAQYDSSFNNGIGDTEALIKEVHAKLKSAGADKIIEELQRQIDRFINAEV